MNVKLREEAPEGLLRWVNTEKCVWPDYLIYRAGWTRDCMTGISSACVKATCSACGESMVLDIRKGGKGVIRAAWWSSDEGPTEYRDYGSYEECFCPVCGERVTAMHVSAFRDELRRYAWPFTMERQGESVIIYLWRVERTVDKQARVRQYVKPWEAYVFEEKQATRCKHWSTYYFGQTTYSEEWIETKKMQDTAGDAELFWCPEGVLSVTEGTALENSKLEIYMDCKTADLYPVTWLRLYQRHHKAENLMTCGTAEAIAQIIASEKEEKYSNRKFSKRLNVLEWLDWKQKRPCDMLRLRKEEMPYFDAHKEKIGTRLRNVSNLRAEGYQIRCGEETDWDVLRQERLIDRGLVPAQVKAYLERQNQTYQHLTDYWRMAEQLGNALTEKRDLMPKDLKEAHDRCAMRQKERRLEHLKADFEKRFRTMSCYAWEENGILIRPVASPTELIREGELLHHCVASYAEKHARGDTTIFLIRKAEEPDKPWYTLEYGKSGTVKQNRGDRNCERTKEVTDFEAHWLAWIRAGDKKKKETQAA